MPPRDPLYDIRTYDRLLGGDDVMPQDDDCLPTPPRVVRRGDKPQRKDMLSRPPLERELAAFARSARALTGLSRKAFAERAGLATSTLLSIENGYWTRISLYQMNQIAEASGKRLKITLG